MLRSGFSLGVLTIVQRPEIRLRVKTHRLEISERPAVDPTTPREKSPHKSGHAAVPWLIHRASHTPRLQRYLLGHYQLTFITPVPPVRGRKQNRNSFMVHPEKELLSPLQESFKTKKEMKTMWSNLKNKQTKTERFITVILFLR